MKHETKVIPTPEATQTFNFRVECSCGWVGRVKTQDEADKLAAYHKARNE